MEAKDTISLVEYRGEVKSLKEWSEVLGIDWNTLRMRYRRGMSGENLFRQDTAPSIAKTIVSYRGEEKTIREWSVVLNMPIDTLKTRYIRGYRGEELFAEYERRKRTNGKSRTNGWEDRLDKVMKLRMNRGN